MGDERTAAFDEFVDGCSFRLLRTARALTGDRGLAEDLVQTALAKTWFHWGSLRDPLAAEAYARKVMTRTHARWWRRKWRGEEPTAVLPDTIGLDEFSAPDQRDLLRRAMAGLPPKTRAALVLRFVADLSEEDTAEALGCSVGTVKSTVSRGLARLRAEGALNGLARVKHEDSA